MKVKRKVAALLAVAMVLTGQPTGVLADGVNAMSESYGATWDDGTTPSDADKENAGDIPEDEKEELAVTVNVDPEDGARVYGAPDEVETGDTLEFNVKVNEGYKLLGVDVSGEELEGDYNEENGRYYYEIENIIFDPTINVSLEKYPEFSKAYDVDGLTFTVEAEEGVIPDDAEVNIVNIEDDAESELDAESVMEEVTKKADTNKYSDPVYGAYRISISDAEGNALEDKDVKNKVTVSVSGVKELSENSELFRAHPEWCLRAPGRPVTRGRAQLVLDLSREDVCEYLIETINSIVEDARIEYVKWDMNLRSYSADAAEAVEDTIPQCSIISLRYGAATILTL